MATQETQPEPPSLEQSKVHRWRYREARRVGMSWFDAKQFADSLIDIEEMRRVARSGYPPDLLLDFLRD